jgi:hypothetical protein
VQSSLRLAIWVKIRVWRLAQARLLGWRSWFEVCVRQKSYYLFEFGIAASQATHRELESNWPLPDRSDVALASRHGGQQILQAAPPFATRKACSVSATKMRRRPRSVELHWRARRSRLRHNLGCAEDGTPQIVLQNQTLG